MSEGVYLVPLKTLFGGLSVAAIVAVASIVAPSSALANSYLVNGSFETGNLAGWTAAGNLEFTGVVGGTFYKFPGAENGDWFVAAGPIGSDGSLSQTFSDTAGQLLSVSGWYNAVGDQPSDLDVIFDGTTLFAATDPNTNRAWTNFSFNVTATGSDSFGLSFRDDPGWIGLDNFSVTPVTFWTIDPPATPLPAALPLFAGGLALMGLLGWLGKGKAAAIGS